MIIQVLTLASFAFMGTVLLNTLMKKMVSEINYTNIMEWSGKAHQNGYLRSGSIQPEKPTKGEVWPIPKEEIKLDIYYTFKLSRFNVKITNEHCPILTNAVARLQKVLSTMERKCLKQRSSWADDNDSYAVHGGYLIELQVYLNKPCEDYPYLYMDERYNLTISTISLLYSDSIWGVLRGLETFSQLFYYENNRTEIRLDANFVTDYPTYSHRGLLLDTARNYITIENILKTLDAMAMNKMNVLHWHIVDNQSFPYHSVKFPELSAKGAFYPGSVYTPRNISMIVEYARDRGIRVVPEFVIPGRTYAISKSHPEILTECFDPRTGAFTGLGPMNPLKTTTYKFLRKLLNEASHLFPDQYFYIGGEEPNFLCWVSNPGIRKYMIKRNISKVSDIFVLFFKKVIESLENKNKIYIFTQDVFDEGVPLPKDSVIQVWNSNWGNEILKVLRHGRRVILTSPWHINGPRHTFQKLQALQPMERLLLENILGGEVCLCDDLIDNHNIINRVWPRASAVAALLWGNEPGPSGNTLGRAEEAACRMRRQGLRADTLLSTRSCDFT